MINFFFLLISIYCYGYFRIGVYEYCRLSGMSKTFIKKNKKGAANYWLYKQLHCQKNLGSLYYINYLYLIGLAVFAFTFILSWIEWLRIPLIAVGFVLSLIEIPAIFKAMVNINRKDFGKAFVVFRVLKGGNGKRWHFSTALDWLFCILPLAFFVITQMKFS